GLELDCTDQAFVDQGNCGLPYVDVTSANGAGITWHPALGGHGNVLFFVKANDGTQQNPVYNYYGTGAVEVRSTDIDGDGDTDEDDENAMRTAIGSQSPDLSTYDLNFDGSVNSSDLTILATEADRRDANNQPWVRGQCTSQDAGVTAYDWNNYK